MIRAAHKICEQNIRNLQGVQVRFPSIDFPQSSVIKEVCRSYYSTVLFERVQDNEKNSFTF